jgi:hypothetical protein
MRFLPQFDKDYGCKNIEYGMDYWIRDEEYNDINTSMMKIFELYKIEIYRKLKQKAKERKLGEIERLKKEIEGLD